MLWPQTYSPFYTKKEIPQFGRIERKLNSKSTNKRIIKTIAQNSFGAMHLITSFQFIPTNITLSKPYIFSHEFYELTNFTNLECSWVYIGTLQISKIRKLGKFAVKNTQTRTLQNSEYSCTNSSNSC